MFLKEVLLGLIGLSAGFLVAAGVFAFITIIGVLTRMAARTKTAKYVGIYEDMVVLGGIAGNMISLYHIPFTIGGWLIPFYGISAGIFVGCLSMALAEVVKVIPIFQRRFKIKFGMPFVLVSFSVGKLLGCLYQLYWFG